MSFYLGTYPSCHSNRICLSLSSFTGFHDQNFLDWPWCKFWKEYHDIALMLFCRSFPVILILFQPWTYLMMIMDPLMAQCGIKDFLHRNKYKSRTTHGLYVTVKHAGYIDPHVLVIVVNAIIVSVSIPCYSSWSLLLTRQQRNWGSSLYLAQQLYRQTQLSTFLCIHHHRYTALSFRYCIFGCSFDLDLSRFTRWYLQCSL